LNHLTVPFGIDVSPFCLGAVPDWTDRRPIEQGRLDVSPDAHPCGEASRAGYFGSG